MAGMVGNDVARRCCTVDGGSCVAVDYQQESEP